MAAVGSAAARRASGDELEDKEEMAALAESMNAHDMPMPGLERPSERAAGIGIGGDGARAPQHVTAPAPRLAPAPRESAPVPGALAELDQRVAALQAEGKQLQALSLLEQSMALKISMYGVEGPDAHVVRETGERLVLLYNSIAMASLAQEDYTFCVTLLKKAEELCSDLDGLAASRIQTLNNLACCYRRMNKPRTAFKILQQSLALCEKEASHDSLSVTHLNTCAILSQLGRHRQAAEHAHSAILHCQEQLLSTSISEQLDSRGDEDRKHELLTEKIVVLGIAYHNLGVEKEYLMQYEECLQWYVKALKLAEEQIGEHESITETFRKSYRAAKELVRERTVFPTASKPVVSKTAAAGKGSRKAKS